MQLRKGSESRGEATRRAILESAEAVFADLGFAAARLEDVAQAVGIRRASLVYYYRSKQELYDAVEAEIFASLQHETIARLEGRDDPWDRIVGIIDCWLDFMVSRPTAARILLRNIADITPRASNPVEFSESTLALVEAVMSEGQAAGLFAPLRPLHFVNIVGGSVLQYVCSAGLYGAGRDYRPDDRGETEVYRRLLHATARTLLGPARA
jgi:TetR/AcrR family transcriptional regulator